MKQMQRTLDMVMVLHTQTKLQEGGDVGELDFEKIIQQHVMQKI